MLPGHGRRAPAGTGPPRRLPGRRRRLARHSCRAGGRGQSIGQVRQEEEAGASGDLRSGCAADYRPVR